MEPFLLLYAADLRELPADRLLAAAEALPEARLKKLRAFRREEDKLRCAAAGLLLRRALETLGADDRSFAYAADGRPVLTARPELFLSLTHSGDYAAALVSGEPASVDVERYGGLREPVLRRVFTGAEQRFVRASADPEAAFCELWSRKECLIKLDASLTPLRAEALTPAPGRRFFSFSLPGCSFVVCAPANADCAPRFLSAGELLV